MISQKGKTDVLADAKKIEGIPQKIQVLESKKLALATEYLESFQKYLKSMGINPHNLDIAFGETVIYIKLKNEKLKHQIKVVCIEKGQGGNMTGNSLEMARVRLEVTVPKDNGRKSKADKKISEWQAVARQIMDAQFNQKHIFWTLFELYFHFVLACRNEIIYHKLKRNEIF